MGSSSTQEIFLATPPAADAHRISPAERRQARVLAWVLALMIAFLAVELSFAFVAQSDVLLADALHLSTDVFALTIALVAIRIAARRPTARFTYGLRRAEPIAAIVNAVLVLAATAVVVADAIDDLRHGGIRPHADIMLYVSVVALVVNAVAAWLIHAAVEASHSAGAGDEVSVQELTALHAHAHAHAHAEPDAHVHGAHVHGTHVHGEAHAHAAARRDHSHDHPHDHGAAGPAGPPRAAAREDGAAAEEGARQQHRGEPHGDRHGHGHLLNLRGAWLHLFGDALASLAAVVTALLLQAGAPAAADPIATFLVAAILIFGAGRLLKEALLVLLEASPRRLPVGYVREAILAIPGVAAVHSLHIWTLGAGHDAITAHVEGKSADPRLGPRVARALKERFHVEYATVQVEVGEGACDTSPRSDAGDP